MTNWWDVFANKLGGSMKTVRIKQLESGEINDYPLDDFLETNARDFTDDELDALHHGDTVTIEPRSRGAYRAEVLR